MRKAQQAADAVRPDAAESTEAPDDAAPQVRHRARPQLRLVADQDRSPTSSADRKDAEPIESAEPTATDYAVGYKRPPLHTRFAKGRSGNPKGRPKAAKSLRSLAREQMNTLVTVKIDGCKRTIRQSEVIVRQLFAQAMKGDLKGFLALRSLLDEAGADGAAVADRAEIAAEPLGATQRAMLADHQRTVLAAQGLSEDAIAAALAAMGLAGAASEVAQ